MNFKNIFSAIIFSIIFLTLTSCDDDEITYPVTYTYNNIEFGDFLLFKLNDTGQEEISFTERLSAIEPIVRADVTFENSEFPFNQITLTSEDQILLKNTNQPADSFSLDYTQLSSNSIRILFGGSGSDPLDLLLAEDNSQLQYCIQSSVFFRQSTTGISSSLDIESCELGQSIDSVIDEIRIDDNLVAGDTVFYNQANMIFLRE